MTSRFTRRVPCTGMFAMVAFGATLLAPCTAHAGALDERVRWRFEYPSGLAGAFVAVGVDGTVYSTDNLHLYAMTPGGDTAYLTTRFVGNGVGHSYLYAIDLTDNPGAMPGDLNGDGVVGIQDFLALLAAWGPCPAPPAGCAADLDGDGTVGITDFLILLANWS